MASQRGRSTRGPAQQKGRPAGKAPTAKPPAAGPASTAARSKAQRRQAASRALEAARGGRTARRRMWMTVGPVALVVALVAVLVIVRVASGSGGPKSGAAAGQAPTSLVSKLASVPAAALDAVGAGTAGDKPFNSLPTKVNGQPLTAGGLPRVLYVGAEYCPYCAAERWAMVVALSRFGSFHNLGTMTSSPSDVFPNTPTLSFHGSTFTSPKVAFNGYEIESNQAQGNGYAPLDKLSSADEALFAASGGSFPYVNIGGKYVISGASYSPGLLAGLTRAQIADALSDPHSKIAQAVLGTANVITAAVCATTNQQPSAVCTSPGVTAAQAKLNG
jgi:hypothetical protein